MSTDYCLSQIMTSPSLAEASKKQYVSKLQKLQSIMNKDLLWIVNHPSITYNAIIHNFNEHHTQAAYLMAVVSIFRHCPLLNLKDGKKKQYDAFQKYYNQVSVVIDENYRQGRVSEKQMIGFVEWPAIIEKRDSLAKSSYGSKEHLILSMYSYINPLRQDFNNLRIFHKNPSQHDQDTYPNYLVISTPSVLVLNEYKTSKTYKTFKKELPPDLVAIIKKSLSIYPRDFLFVDSKGLPYEKENSYVKAVNRSLKDIFDKPTTVTLLRRARSTYERSLNLTPGEEEDAARDMLHSEKMHNRYRVMNLPVQSSS